MRFEELPHKFKVDVIEILLNQDYGAESLVTYLENKEDFDIEYDDYDDEDEEFDSSGERRSDYVPVHHNQKRPYLHQGRGLHRG